MKRIRSRNRVARVGDICLVLATAFVGAECAGTPHPTPDTVAPTYEAAAEAYARFGSVPLVADQCRDALMGVRAGQPA